MLEGFSYHLDCPAEMCLKSCLDTGIMVVKSALAAKILGRYLNPQVEARIDSRVAVLTLQFSSRGAIATSAIAVVHLETQKPHDIYIDSIESTKIFL